MGVLSDLMRVVAFWYVKRSLVLSVGVNYASGVSQVSFKLGADWTKVDFTPGTMEFTEKQNEIDNKGLMYIQSFAGQLPANKFVYPLDLQDMTEEPVICKLELSNGLILIAGSMDIPVRMRYSMQTSDNGCVISFERNAVYKAFLWTSDSYLPPPAPVVAAATGITATGFTAAWAKTATATGYYIDVSASATFAGYVAGYENKEVGDVSSLAINGLTANTPYYYRVRGFNEHVTGSNSNTVSVTTAT